MSGSTSTSRNSAVVYITADDGTYVYQGSGVLISPDEVLTASHLANIANGFFQVSPGYDAGSAPYGTLYGEYAHYNFIDDGSGSLTFDQITQDFAVIHLDEPITAAGTMGLLSDTSPQQAYTAGYPGTAGGSQIITSVPVSVLAPLKIYSVPLNIPGSSGGPLFVLQGGQADVIGLVSASTETAGLDVKLTGADVTLINQWVYQDDLTDPLVDAPFYDVANPDVAAASFSAAFHYHNTGWREGRDPDAFFSTTGYLASNQDVKRAGIDPLTQYDGTGWREGRNPSVNFDTRLYLLNNPDVAASGMDPLQHYLQYGQAEARATYTAIGPASEIVGGFDPDYYLLANPDVAASGINPWVHFNATGWREGRNPNAIFNTRDYELANPDVAAAGINPLTHYDTYGWKEGRDPSPSFDTRAYLAAYKDVAAARVDPMQHYLQYGVYEHLSTFGAAAS